MHNEAQRLGRCDTASCLEVVRNNEKYYLLDTKAYKAEEGPLVATLSSGEYHDRLEKVRLSGDPGAMFDSEGQQSRFRGDELKAFAAYAIAGRLGNLADRQQVVAYRDMRDLPGQEDLG